MGLSPKAFTFATGCFVALGSILFGYDLGVIAGVLVAQDFIDTTGNPDATYIGFIVSALLLGAFCGCIPAGLLADRFGRRWAIVVGCVIFMLGGILQVSLPRRPCARRVTSAPDASLTASASSRRPP
jgi:MFS family permease